MEPKQNYIRWAPGISSDPLRSEVARGKGEEWRGIPNSLILLNRQPNMRQGFGRVNEAIGPGYCSGILLFKV